MIPSLRLHRTAWILALLVAALGCSRTSPARPPDVILISLDTTRADHIGAYGSAIRTPEIDRVAAEGVLFENVSSACTTTLPSHVSMLTGLWPTRHGVVKNGHTVSDANRMLPEILAEAGYETAGISAAVALSKLLGFAQGFAHWDQDPETLEGPEVANRDARTASEITDAAIGYLEQRSSEAPLFLFVHYVDPHSPYAPPEPYRTLYGDVPAGLVGSNAVIREARSLASRVAGEPSDLDRQLARLYAGEVSYMDVQVGRLLAALAERGLYDDALIVVTADHGETFWEHTDLWSHGLAAYETTVRIPLILRLPGARHAGVRVPGLVSNVDVLPTILELLGLQAPPGIDGSSLVPAIAGAPSAPRAVYSQGPLPGGSLERGTRWKNERKAHSIRVGKWKLIRTPYRGLEELYDLEADPGEQRNLVASEDPVAVERRRQLGDQLQTWISSADPLPSEFFPRVAPTTQPDAEARRAMWEQLKALGYVSEEEEQPER